MMLIIKLIDFLICYNMMILMIDKLYLLLIINRIKINNNKIIINNKLNKNKILSKSR